MSKPGFTPKFPFLAWTDRNWLFSRPVCHIGG
jgi:hypothetical protein